MSPRHATGSFLAFFRSLLIPFLVLATIAPSVNADDGRTSGPAPVAESREQTGRSAQDPPRDRRRKMRGPLGDEENVVSSVEDHQVLPTVLAATCVWE